MVILILLIFIFLIIKCKKKIDYQDERPTYNDLLNDDRWKWKRAQILKRDNNSCVYCGRDNNLQVHHKYYCRYPNGVKANPWDYPDDALITLCDECHKKVHSSKTIKVYYRRYNEHYE